MDREREKEIEITISGDHDDYSNCDVDEDN
jgi:hypothetical protein